jgi:hypothetical protein
MPRDSVLSGEWSFAVLLAGCVWQVPVGRFTAPGRCAEQNAPGLSRCQSSCSRALEKGGLSLKQWDTLDVAVKDSTIIVTLRGSRFKAVYYKAHGQRQLILRERTKTDDQELVAEAMKAANDKARELGWIV